MAHYSRKAYQETANILKHALSQSNELGVDKREASAIIARVAMMFAVMYQDDNVNFNTTRFLNAVTGGK